MKDVIPVCRLHAKSVINFMRFSLSKTSSNPLIFTKGISALVLTTSDNASETFCIWTLFREKLKECRLCFQRLRTGQGISLDSTYPKTDKYAIFKTRIAYVVPRRFYATKPKGTRTADGDKPCNRKSNMEQLNSTHVTPKGLQILQPRPHWWEADALTAESSLLWGQVNFIH